MNLFVNDVYVHFAKVGEFLAPDRFNHIVECSKERITRANLIHHVLVKDPTEEDIDSILTILNHLNTRHVYSVTITSDNILELKNYLKSKFSIIKAAGGIVRKGNKILMIHRMKKWDLPKGKINKRENTKAAAVREVEEECNINVKATGKICNTWHTYTLKKKPILKKTSWYLMKLIDDSEMKPQLEEDIEEVKWMTPKQRLHALEQSYQSIRFVIHEYEKPVVK